MQTVRQDATYRANQAQYLAVYRATNHDRLRASNREYNRRTSRTIVLKRHGMTEQGYDALLRSQGGVCGICGSAEPGGRWKRFSVDHDHITQEVRGLLCNNCNQALGFFQDSSVTLARGIAYLDQYRATFPDENVTTVDLDQLLIDEKPGWLDG